MDIQNILKNPRVAEMRARLSAMDPETARLNRLVDQTGRAFGTGIKQGKWQGFELDKPVTGWFDNRADCIAALERIALESGR